MKKQNENQYNDSFTLKQTTKGNICQTKQNFKNQLNYKEQEISTYKYKTMI